MNSVVEKIIGLFAMFVFSSICFLGCSGDAIKALITPTSIKTIAEYGTYFGSKAGNLAKDDANKIKIALEGIIKVIDSESVNDVVDISNKIEDLPDIVKKYLGEAIAIVNDNFVKVKGKIPADKLPYVKAVFAGGLEGINKYIASIEKISVNSGYETELAGRYLVVKKKLK